MSFPTRALGGENPSQNTIRCKGVKKLRSTDKLLLALTSEGLVSVPVVSSR